MKKENFCNNCCGPGYANDILFYRSGEQVKKKYRYLLLFAIGAVCYSGLELLWRGRTHWTMALVGGLCFVLLVLIGCYGSAAMWQKWVMGMAVITTIEFVAGCVINLHLGWYVWDYSYYAFNLMGQICLRYSFFWLILSVPGIFIGEKLLR